jgi:hypothetical protein
MIAEWAGSKLAASKGSNAGSSVALDAVVAVLEAEVPVVEVGFGAGVDAVVTAVVAVAADVLAAAPSLDDLSSPLHAVAAAMARSTAAPRSVFRTRTIVLSAVVSDELHIVLLLLSDVLGLRPEVRS